MRAISNFHLNELKDILESNSNASISEDINDLKAEIGSNYQILESEGEWQNYSEEILGHLHRFVDIVESTRDDQEKNAREQFENDVKEHGHVLSPLDEYTYAFKKKYESNITGLHSLIKYVQSLQTFGEATGETHSVQLGDIVKSAHLRVLTFAIAKYISECSKQPEFKPTLDQITKRSIARVIVQSLLKPDGTNFSIKKIENEDTSRPMTATDINEVAAVLNDLHDLLIEVRDNPSDEGRYFHS